MCEILSIVFKYISFVDIRIKAAEEIQGQVGVNFDKFSLKINLINFIAGYQKTLTT